MYAFYRQNCAAGLTKQLAAKGDVKGIERATPKIINNEGLRKYVSPHRVSIN